MSLKVRKEEYAPLADFVRVSFVRDQASFVARFPKMDVSFLADFDAKITTIKSLESGLVLTEEQKTATSSLYNEANTLNVELNFLSRYMKDAGLNSEAVSNLKKDLRSNNIEGALLKMESVKQFITANTSILQAEGMASDFNSTLDNHIMSLSEKNKLQNELMNARKKLTEVNSLQYNELYKMTMKIINAGKLIFTDGAFNDEYVVSKVTQRMRVSKATPTSIANPK